MTDSIFIFSSVGSNLSRAYKTKVFRSWNLDHFDSGCVIYNNDSQFPYYNHFKKTINRLGFKFPNFFYFDDKFDIINNYDYICILDDDLLFKQNNSIEETVSVMQKFDISLCSLSNNNEFKKAAYDVMYSSDASKPRVAITNFCEMGCMIFHKSLLKLVKQGYENDYRKLTDWGFDWYICSLAEKNNHTIGIVKHLYFSNPFQDHRNIGYYNWIDYKDNINYIHPLTYGIIDVTN